MQKLIYDILAKNEQELRRVFGRDEDTDALFNSIAGDIEQALQVANVSGSGHSKGEAAIELLKQIDAWLSFNAEPDAQELRKMRSSIQEVIKDIPPIAT